MRPLAITAFSDAWTFVGWCELRDDFRVFRLDRIDGGVTTGASFKLVPGKTLEDYLVLQALGER